MDPLPNVEMIPFEEEGKKVLQLKVVKGKFTPYYYVGDGQRIAYVRNGTDSLPATDEEMKRLVLSGANRTFAQFKVLELSSSAALNLEPAALLH